MRVLDVLRERSPNFEAAVARAAETLGPRSEGAVAEAIGPLDSAAQPPSRAAVEAIILADLRPAWFIENDTIVVDGEYDRADLVAARKSALEEVSRQVGRVDLIHHSTLDYAGTGWMVAPDIAVTNRHVAEVFSRARPLGGWEFAPGRFGDVLGMQLNPNRQREEAGLSERRAEAVEILWIAPRRGPDIAFIRVAPGHGIDPLNLSSRPAGVDLPVAAIGYPAWDGNRNDPDLMTRIFGGIYNLKRFSPGLVIGTANDGRSLLSDYTSLGGNSGSAVIALETGDVVGLHFAGVFREANFAVPADLVAAALREIEGRLHPVAAPATPVTDADDLTDGKGYDPEFLGAGELSVPLPGLGQRSSDAAPVEGRTDGVLTYTHFSTVQSSSRRLPLLTAVNLDGTQSRRVKRRDNWRFDPRLLPAHQIGNELYRSNPLDRGHMVRRRDAGWGATDEEARQGEDDTFHYTNCAPQHGALNQRDWLGLEDYVLENAVTRGFRASVFTGPVFRETDPRLREQPGAEDVAIPESFWKVVVMVHDERGTLSATAYVLDQGDMIRPLTEAAFVFGEYKTYQVPVRMVEEATGLDFGPLRAADPLDRAEAVFGEAVRPVTGPDDLRL